MSRLETVKCDICKAQIKTDTGFVSARHYGYDFHLECLKTVNGTLIGLIVDDIKIVNYDTEARFYWDGVVK